MSTDREQRFDSWLVNQGNQRVGVYTMDKDSTGIPSDLNVHPLTLRRCPNCKGKIWPFTWRQYDKYARAENCLGWTYNHLYLTDETDVYALEINTGFPLGVSYYSCDIGCLCLGTAMYTNIFGSKFKLEHKVEGGALVKVNCLWKGWVVVMQSTFIWWRWCIGCMVPPGVKYKVWGSLPLEWV